MIAYHLDLKISLFQRSWLRELFATLARLGYTHVCFEIEDSVRLESLPEVAKIDAYSKDEFCTILSDCREAGLEPFPLMQTMGHLEFLLHHNAYRHLRDQPEALAEISARSDQARALVAKVLDEVHELFDRPELFHLGADEVRSITPRAESDKSVGEIYSEHISHYIRQLIEHGARPMIWADIVLAHPDTVEMLPREVIMCDWDYWTVEDPSQSIMAWGCSPARATAESAFELPDWFVDHYSQYYTDERGRVFNAWFYADFLRNEGFDAVICPSVRCFGDNYCSPRAIHSYNVVSAGVRYGQGDLTGMIVTDWAVRLNHVSTHLPHMALSASAVETGTDKMSRHEKAACEALGFSSLDVYRAIEMLSDLVPLAREKGVLSRSHHLGARGDIYRTIIRMHEEGELRTEMDRVLERGQDCKAASEMLAAVSADTDAGAETVEHLRLAAATLAQKASQFLIVSELIVGSLPQRKHVLGLLDEIYDIRDRTRALFGRSHREASLAREINARFLGEEMFLTEFGLP